MKYKIINQMLKTFIQQEKKFFETCYFLINNFYNGMGILEQSLPYQKSTYDPMKYIRANKIMEGVDANSLPNIKMKDKYSFDTYKNSKSSQINYNDNFNKKYSFDEYKLRKSNINNSSILNVNQNNNINNINTIKNDNNQNNDLKPLNPYSYEAYKKRTQSLDTIKRQNLNNNNINNNNADYYQSNLNLVMNSVIDKDNTKQINPFSDMFKNNEINPYSIKDNNMNNNPYNFFNNNNKNNNIDDNSKDVPNPYASIFNNKNNNPTDNNKNVINSFFNSNIGNNNQSNNNNKKPKDKYNFGF